MEVVEKSKRGRFTRTVARASCAVFTATLLFLAFEEATPAVHVDGPIAALVPFLGFLLGSVAMFGATTARRNDILAAFAGVIMNLVFMLLLSSQLPHGCRNGRDHSPRIFCMVNLKQLNGAKATWAFEYHKGTNDIPADTDLFGTNAYVSRKPVCPENGVYRIGRVGELPSCSIPGHTL